MKSKAKSKRKNTSFSKFTGFIVLIIFTAIAVILAKFNMFQKLDYRLYDYTLGLSKEIETNEDIVLIDIDDESLGRIGAWPWTRDIIGNSLLRMKEFGARQAIFDIEYLSSSTKGINENLEDGYWDVNSKLGKEIDSIQRGYYPTKSTLMYWLEYNTLTKGDDKPTSIFPQYREWCKENGYKAKTLIAFINELKKRFPQFIDNTGVLSLKVMPKDTPNTENTDSFFSNLGLKNKEINVNEDFE